MTTFNALASALMQPSAQVQMRRQELQPSMGCLANKTVEWKKAYTDYAKTPVNRESLAKEIATLQTILKAEEMAKLTIGEVEKLLASWSPVAASVEGTAKALEKVGCLTDQTREELSVVNNFVKLLETTKKEMADFITDYAANMPTARNALTALYRKVTNTEGYLDFARANPPLEEMLKNCQIQDKSPEPVKKEEGVEAKEKTTATQTEPPVAERPHVEENELDQGYDSDEEEPIKHVAV